MPIYIQGVEQSSGGAPTDADYLVGTTQGGLSAEIVAGAAPAGELGGTWAAPTVDATHSGSAHHAESHAHSSHTGIGATDHHSNANDHAQAHGPAQHTTGTAWRDTYQDALGDDTEIALGAAGTYKRSAGAAAAPTYAQPAHSELSGIGATDHHSNANDHVNAILAHGPSAHTTGTAWRLVYQDANGDEQEIALGAADTFLRSAGASAAPAFAAIAAAGVTRAGGNTTEATTTSVTAVDLLTISSLSIGAGQTAYGINLGRKSAGAAVGAGLAIKINTTIIQEAMVGENTREVCGIFTATNRAENTFSRWEIPAVVSNYTFPGVVGLYSYWSTGGNPLGAGTARTMDAARPNATITDIIIRAISGSALVTVGADEAHVYAEAIS